jgi:small Trp-rich protein
MYLLGLGLVLMLLKYLAIDPVATLSWWWVLSPFALAVLWWQWADASGYTKRKAMEQQGRRREERHARVQENLGTINRKGRP